MATIIVDLRRKKLYPFGMITPEQSRAARGWLDWTQADLAERANVSLSTIRDFEKGRRSPIKNNLEAIRLSLEMAGVTLLFRGDTPIGLQFRQGDAA